MAFFTAIAAADQIGFGIDDITKPIGNLFSFGSTCNEDQKKQKQEIANQINEYLTIQDMQDLTEGMESDVTPRASDMADFYLGGRDCKHKNVTPGDQDFIDRLPGLIQRRKREAESRTVIDRAAAVTSGQVVPGVPKVAVWVVGLILAFFAFRGISG